MTTWEQMSQLEQSQCIYWDMYKDAYGVRPRGIDTSSWTVENFAEEFRMLSDIIRVNEYDRVKAEESAAHDFEVRVQNLIQCGARSRDQALKWIHEAEGSNGDDDFLCHLIGLPYGYFRKAA